jgi:2Fe-2S ferredoxin
MPRIRFEPDGIEVEVPVGSTILEAARKTDAHMGSACGGVCACSTCHVYVREGQESCSPATENEEDELDKAPAVTPDSRLSCQCVPDGSSDVVVVVPRWNRNQVKEGDH